MTDSKMPEPVAPPCWWIDHGGYGQITLREDEAIDARKDGKMVVSYTHPAPVADAELEALIERLNGPAARNIGLFREAVAAITALRARKAQPVGVTVKPLVDALSFYADASAWNQPPVRTKEGLLSIEYENQASRMQRDRGRIAREALATAQSWEGGV